MDTQALANAAQAKKEGEARTIEAYQQTLCEYLLDAHPTLGDNPKTYPQIIAETSHIPGFPRTASGISLLSASLGIPPRPRGRWKGMPSPLRERNVGIAEEVRKCEHTLQQIADKHGITRERVRQIAKAHGITRTEIRNQ